MQGLVTIDFGNSHPHAGLFHKNQNKWQLIKVVAWNDVAIHLSQLQMTPANTSLVLSEVKSRETELAPLQLQGFLLTRVKDYWKGAKFAGMPVDYTKTLGEDRLIQAFYAYKKIKQPVLIIDAGTFTTIDVVTSAGFKGGFITPGVEAYFSTFKKGYQLKDFKFNQNFEAALPKGTLEAMRDSYSAFAALAKELIEQHKLVKVLLTGGQSELWKGFLSNLPQGVVVQAEPNLIHSALHYWMTTQIEPI